jgi:general secretion pathway protein G
MLLSLCSVRRVKSKPHKNGFTLLEMLIVTSIILVLAAIAVPKLNSSAKTAKVAKVQADMRTVANAAALCEAETGKKVGKVSELTVEIEGKKYLQAEPKTPEGGDYSINEEGVVTCTFDNKPYSSTDQPVAGKPDSGKTNP